MTRTHPASDPILSSRVALLLEKVGFEPSAIAEGDEQVRAERLATGLMVVFRETRCPEVFNTLYRHTHRSLLTWICHLLRARSVPGDGHDLVQDVFVNVYSYAGSFREGGGHTFMGWSRTIAANVVRRSTRRRRAVALPEWDHFVDLHGGPCEQAQLREQAPDLVQAWLLLLQLYLAAYRGLSPRDQKVMHMTEVRGLSYAQVADDLQLRRDNVKMIMFRARQRLRAAMHCQFLRGEDPASRCAS